MRGFELIVFILVASSLLWAATSTTDALPQRVGTSLNHTRAVVAPLKTVAAEPEPNRQLAQAYCTD